MREVAEFKYWHKGRGEYVLDTESVENAPEGFKDLYLPNVIFAGSQIAFRGDVYGYVSKQRERGYKYVDSEKFKKPKVHTIFTVEYNG
jgi:hypothetical protein|nr:MAG TPA: hypothetical protein [Caudoviricetes sp.]